MKIALMHAYDVCVEMIDEYPTVFSAGKFRVYWDSMAFNQNFITKPLPAIYYEPTGRSARYAGTPGPNAESVLASAVTGILLEVNKWPARYCFHWMMVRDAIGERGYNRKIRKIRKRLGKRLAYPVLEFLARYDISLTQMIDDIVMREICSVTQENTPQSR